MLENFERFTKPGQTFDPKVSIRKRGQIGFNQGLINLFSLDKYDYVVLFISKDRDQIAFKFTQDPKEEGAIRIAKRKSNYFIAAKNFLDYYQVDYSDTKSFPAKKIENEDAAFINLQEQES